VYILIIVLPPSGVLNKCV